MARRPPPPNGGVSARIEAMRRRNDGRGSKTPPPSPASFDPDYVIPEWGRVINTHIRSVDSKAQASVIQMGVLIKKIEQLTEQVNLLSTQVLRSQQFILRLLDDPEAQHHAAAVVRDHFIQRKANE